MIFIFYNTCKTEKNLLLKLQLGEHILTLQNLVTGYKVIVEYDDINYLLTIIGFSIYKSFHVLLHTCQNFLNLRIKSNVHIFQPNTESLGN
jgi:hypothetical protein